jgi:hypothetical protein
MPPENPPQGTPTQSGQGEGDAPKYVTEEQLNRAISARLGDFGKKIEKTISESLATTLTAKLDELKTSLSAPGAGEGGSKETPKGVDIENHPLVKGLQKQIADQKSATERLQQERDAEKASARDQKLRSALSDSLTKGGIDPTRVRHAVGILVDVEKRVRFADDDGDELVFKDSTGDVDLTTGLKGWLKSEDAKIFLPPRGTLGAGDRSQGKTTQNGQAAPTVGAALLGMARGVMGENPNG